MKTTLTRNRRPGIVSVALITSLLVAAIATNRQPALAGPNVSLQTLVADRLASGGDHQSEPDAAVGSGLTYQGQLKDGGNPANGSYDFQFRLYDALSGGTQVGSTITILSQAVAAGLFTVQLDFGATAYQGQARWLELAVRTAGGPSYTTLSPRQPLNATPYAASLMPGSVVTGTVNAVISAIGGGSTGLYGESTAAGGRGVTGQSNNGIGVRGVSTSLNGVEGTTAGGVTASGVSGTSTGNNGIGVRGTANTGTTANGVEGVSSSGRGVYGSTGSGTGVWGASNTGFGLYGVSTGNWGIKGFGASGVWGDSVAGYGVSGSTSGGPSVYGVYGTSTGTNGIGVTGQANTGSSAIGVWGTSTSGRGVYGTSTSSVGVQGASTNGAGVYGTSTNSDAGYFVSTGTGMAGVYGRADSGWGVHGTSVTGDAGIFTSGSGRGIGAGGSPWAANFIGDVSVTDDVIITGNLAKGSGSFRIDHPLDPENKILYHSFVESPDMMNVYNGNVILDAKGEAVVTLPNWFEALNKEFRYQLTTIGGFAPVYVAEKVKGNSFRIAGGKAGLEVSWQVTGIRQDPYAEAHRIQVEVEKSAGNKGKYIHPLEYGQPESKGLDYETKQEIMGPRSERDLPNHQELPR